MTVTATTAATRHAVRSPSDGTVVGEVAWADADAVAATAARLRAAQPAWLALGPRGRGAALARFGRWLADERPRLERLLIAETGKSASDARVEIPMILELLAYYGRHAGRFLAPERRPPASALVAHKRVTVHRRPYPLVGVIAPWNYPIAMALLDAVPALAAGCAVLVKPSELTPLTTAEIVRGWRARAGAPAVLDAALGAVATGEAVVDAVDMVQFTGSSRGGRAVMERAARRLTPVSLELGGKDAMLVLDDADLERAASAAVWGGLFNAGQTCVSVERVYVHETVHDRFVALVVDQVRALRQGSGDGHDLGALIDERQLATVERHVAQARAAGARVAIGGGRRPGPGCFHEPTVLVDVDQAMDCMREETFGPTLPIMRVRDEEQAVALANDSAYGLSASVFTRDRERGRRIAARLECGAVNVNDVIVNLMTTTAPHGGWKTSGIGARMGGAEGLRKFCRTEVVVESRIALRHEPLWYAAGDRVRALADRLLVGHARRALRRLERAG
ncbi:aldehyde dehydrogenase family protein [Patulibacter defluvii]|uniref:aldehyde dehydrogenase family protein n=1 Tax=Patulibacter defluvii TaxID=3095358 RepID=UPI002A7600AB|nr:aldehyde dehydrogenase family protein [Patulibacter sp. DM4]